MSDLKDSKYETKLIPLSQIKADETFNARSDIGDLSDILPSIRLDGVNHTPCDVRREKGGKSYYLVAGFRRFACLQEIDADYALCTIFPSDTTKKQMMLWNLQENVVRKDLNPMDEAVRCHELLETGFLKEELTEALGWSKNKLTQRLGLLDMSDAIKEALFNDELTVRQAHEINRLAGDLQEQYINEACGLTVAALKAAVDNELGAASTDANPPEDVAEPEEGEQQSLPLNEDDSDSPEDADDLGPTDEGEDDDTQTEIDRCCTDIQIRLKDLAAYTFQDEEDSSTRILKSNIVIDSIDWGVLSISDLDAFAAFLSDVVSTLDADSE